MRTDVLVVGGGPSGSNAARLLGRDHEVMLVEEHNTPGEPLQCAGLVTKRCIPEFARRSIVSEVRGARLHSPLGYTLSLESKSAKAYVIDRSMLDKIMFHEAVDAGALPRLGTAVHSVVDSGSHVSSAIRIDGKSESVESKLVIGADGYRSLCRTAAHLPSPKHMVTGIQVDLKSVDVDPDFVDVYFGRDIAPGFFAWVIPACDVVRVGLCTWDSKDVPAVYLKKLLRRPEFKNAKRVSLASGKIPIGPGKTAVGGRIMLVGDAACHAKPLSGGGVYTGIKGSELCSGIASRYMKDSERTDLADYDRLWKEEFGKELTRAFRIRRIFLNLTDKKIDKALRVFADPSVKRLLEKEGDIDYPASLASTVLKLAPKLAQFSPQIIESFL